MTGRANEALAVPSKGELQSAPPAQLQRKCTCAEQGESCARCNGAATKTARTQTTAPARMSPSMSWFQVRGSTVYVQGLAFAKIRVDDSGQIEANATVSSDGGRHVSLSGPMPASFTLHEGNVEQLRKLGYHVSTLNWGERGFVITADLSGTAAPAPNAHQGAAKTPVAKAPEPEPLLAHKSGKQLVDENTKVLNLDEDKLGTELLAYARQGSIDTVESALDELWDTNRDDVAAALVNAAIDEQLEAIARTDAGRKLFLRLFDHLTSGYMDEAEATAAERLMSARIQQIDPNEFIEAPEHATVIPFSGIGWTKFSSASLSVKRTEHGKIRVRSHMKAEHWDKAQHLPGIAMLVGDGVEMDPDTIVGIYNYDEGEKISYVPAMYLLQLSNMEATKVHAMMGEAAITGLSIGMSGAAAGGARVATSAAPSRSAVCAARGLTALKWADRGATVMDVASTLINDHRGLILKHGGEDGAQLLKHWATIERIVGAYGKLRGGLALRQTALALRSTLKQWRARRAALKELSAKEAAALDSVVAQTEKSLEEIDAAQRPSARQRVAGGMNDETADMLARNPELLDALAKHPNAAQALTLCESMCIPEFAKPSQVARVERMLARAKAEGKKLKEGARLKKYLHLAKNRVELTEALDTLEWRMNKPKVTTPDDPMEAIFDEADLLEQPGIRIAKPDDIGVQEMRHGNRFNERNQRRYPYNELTMHDKDGSPRRLDSYRPPKSGGFLEGEIVSRKSLVTAHGQIAGMDPDTMLDYFQEFQLKYPNHEGKVFANVPEARGLAGQQVKGRYILEVPPQKWPIPERILRDAKASGVTIRDTRGRVYFDAGRPK
jgi:hypothetical protein